MARKTEKKQEKRKQRKPVERQKRQPRAKAIEKPAKVEKTKADENCEISAKALREQRATALLDYMRKGMSIEEAELTKVLSRSYNILRYKK